jgi:hypothetical protein
VSKDKSTLAEDLLIGVEPIAKYLGMKDRAVYHAASKGYLPVFHIGERIAARKSQLDKLLSAPVGEAE